MEKNDCAILVNSCDLYQDAWEPFFRLFHIQWPDCPFKIYLNTETKKYECDYLNVETICSGKGKTWSERVLNAIKHIESKYILFFLEDFFLMSPVKIDIFFTALDILESDESVGVVSFNPDVRKALGYWIIAEQYDNSFSLLSKKSKYRVNAQANLWERKFLSSLIRKCENPWEFEVYGTIRAKRSRKKFLCRPANATPVFDYHTYQGYGYGLNRGKWLPKNQELFEKYDISVDYERLGWWNAAEHIHKPRTKRSKKELLALLLSNPRELVEIVYTKISQ